MCPEKSCAQKKWGKGRLKRLIGAGAGLLFKGSGFYITDYRSEGYKAAAKKEGESKSAAAESKPASDTAAKPAAAKGDKQPASTGAAKT